MIFDGNDYTVLGLAPQLVGGYLLARSYLVGDSVGTALGFLGANPYQIRNHIQAQYEARTGFALFSVGLLITLAGIVRSTYFGRPGALSTSLYPVLLVALVALALCWTVTRIVDWLARKRYVPILCQLQRRAYENALHVLAHDGEYRDAGEPLGFDIPRGHRDGRIESARGTVRLLADLFGDPWKEGETESVVIERLRRQYFS